MELVMDKYYVTSFCSTLFFHGFVTVLPIVCFPFHHRWCRAWITGMVVSQELPHLPNRMHREYPIWWRVLKRLSFTRKLFRMKTTLLGVDMVRRLVWMWTIRYVVCSIALYSGLSRGLSRTTRQVWIDPYRVTYLVWALGSLFCGLSANDCLCPNTQDFLL